jgi:hypothetical protein
MPFRHRADTRRNDRLVLRSPTEGATMTELKITEDGDDADYVPPAPEKSTVMFQLIEGDSFYLPGLEIDGCVGNGGSWEIEGIQGTEVEAVETIIGQFDDKVLFAPGHWIILGFFGRFSVEDTPNGLDYDCRHEADEVRPATPEEIAEMW